MGSLGPEQKWEKIDGWISMRRLIPLVVISLVVVSMVFLGGLILTYDDGSLESVSGLKIKETTIYLGLSWESVDGAECYQIIRDDEPIAETSRLHYNDSDVINGEDHCYRIRAVKKAFFLTQYGGLSNAIWGNLTPMSYDNQGFASFDTDCYEFIMGMGYDFEEAGKAMDLGRIRLLSQNLEDLCKDLLQESYLFNLTTELQPSLDEFRYAMEDLIIGCQKVKGGIEHLNQSLAFEGIDYITVGVEHLQNSVDML